MSWPVPAEMETATDGSGSLLKTENDLNESSFSRTETKYLRTNDLES